MYFFLSKSNFWSFEVFYWTPSTLKKISLFFRTAQQAKREIRMAYVAFAIVGIFLSFNLPRIMVAGYEVSQTWLILHCVQNGSEYMPNLPFYYWDNVSRLCMAINSSINFFIYCRGSDQFKVHKRV